MRVDTEETAGTAKKQNLNAVDMQDETYVKKMMENVDKMLYLTEDDIKLQEELKKKKLVD